MTKSESRSSSKKKRDPRVLGVGLVVVLVVVGSVVAVSLNDFVESTSDPTYIARLSGRVRALGFGNPGWNPSYRDARVLVRNSSGDVTRNVAVATYRDALRAFRYDKPGSTPAHVSTSSTATAHLYAEYKNHEPALQCGFTGQGIVNVEMAGESDATEFWLHVNTVGELMWVQVGSWVLEFWFSGMISGFQGWSQPRPVLGYFAWNTWMHVRLETTGKTAMVYINSAYIGSLKTVDNVDPSYNVRVRTLTTAGTFREFLPSECFLSALDSQAASGYIAYRNTYLTYETDLAVRPGDEYMFVVQSDLGPIGTDWIPLTP